MESSIVGMKFERSRSVRLKRYPREGGVENRRRSGSVFVTES